MLGAEVCLGVEGLGVGSEQAPLGGVATPSGLMSTLVHQKLFIFVQI